MTDINSHVKKYIGEISRILPCSKKQKREIEADLKANIDDFLLANENASMNDIVANFGKPEDIAESYAVGMNHNEIHQATSKKKAIVTSLVAVVAILLVMAGISVYKTHKMKVDGFFVDTSAKYDVSDSSTIESVDF